MLCTAGVSRALKSHYRDQLSYPDLSARGTNAEVLTSDGTGVRALPYIRLRAGWPQPPTEAPTATTNPEATATAAALRADYATLQAQTQTAIEAWATASPFPTALPAKVIQGWPAVATGQRDGSTLTVRLPKDLYWAGEGGLADVEIRNSGPESVFINGSGTDLALLALVDQLGQQPDLWPFSSPPT